MHAVVLKKNVFSEGNEIITLYTRELGKVRAVARSVRSPRSKLAFGLQTLFHSDVELVMGKKLATITGVKPIDTFKDLQSHLQSIYLALHACELILKSTADEQPNEELFDMFVALLQHLDTHPNTNHLCIHVFGLQVLAFTGYRLDFEHCAHCGKQLDGESAAAFSNRRSGFLCQYCAEQANDAVSVSTTLYAMLRGGLSMNFDNIDASGVPESELKAIIQPFISHILERNLNTRGYLDTLK